MDKNLKEIGEVVGQTEQAIAGFKRRQLPVLKFSWVVNRNLTIEEHNWVTQKAYEIARYLNGNK